MWSDSEQGGEGEAVAGHLGEKVVGGGLRRLRIHLREAVLAGGEVSDQCAEHAVHRPLVVRLHRRLRVVQVVHRVVVAVAAHLQVARRPRVRPGLHHRRRNIRLRHLHLRAARLHLQAQHPQGVMSRAAAAELADPRLAHVRVVGLAAERGDRVVGDGEAGAGLGSGRWILSRRRGGNGVGVGRRRAGGWKGD